MKTFCSRWNFTREPGAHSLKQHIRIALYLDVTVFLVSRRGLLRVCERKERLRWYVSRCKSIQLRACVLEYGSGVEIRSGQARSTGFLSSVG